MVGAVCIWGIYSVFSKWATMKASPLICTLYSGVFGLIILLPFNAGDFTVTEWNASFTVSLLYTGVVSTVLCMLFGILECKSSGLVHPESFEFQSCFYVCTCVFPVR